jgi:transposase
MVSAKHHRRVSAIAALSISPKQKRTALHFQLTQASFKTAEVIEFLRRLHRQLRTKIILVLDRLNAHRSAAQWFQKHRPSWFIFEWLPAYAPELNPIEQCWSHSKCHDLPNLCASSVESLQPKVAACLSGKRCTTKLHRAWLARAQLPLRHLKINPQ